LKKLTENLQALNSVKMIEKLMHRPINYLWKKLHLLVFNTNSLMVKVCSHVYSFYLAVVIKGNFNVID